MSAALEFESPVRLSAVPLPLHQQAMQLAIAAARANRFFPFGAVIVRAANRQVMATGVNNGSANPTLHGEIVAINDYVARHGNRGWEEVILYTTGEPCPMCMAALAWTRISGIVYGTSIEKLCQFGIDQILIPASAVIAAAPFYRGEILGPVLADETDALFLNRERLPMAGSGAGPVTPAQSSFHCGQSNPSDLTAYRNDDSRAAK